MKKSIIMFLLSAVILTAFAGCNKDNENNVYSEASYDNESRFVPNEKTDESDTIDNTESQSPIAGESIGNNAIESNESQEPMTGEFIVKDKKYTFEDKNLVVVSVENKTNKNYAVTITGTYLDKHGNELKTETQTFDQYYAGYGNYFLFEPDMQFDKFVYTFDAKETSNVIYASKLKATFVEIYEKKVPHIELQDDFTLYPTIIAYFEYEKETSDTLDIRSQWILFDENDNIVDIVPVGTFLWKELEGQQYPLYYTKEDALVWPEKYRGNIRAIHVLQSIVIGVIPQ